jgi:zinc transport system substrate-binding protein
VASAALTGCGGSGPAADTDAGGQTPVVAAFYPLAFAAERVGGEAVSVTNLTPVGAEPHDVELTARDVERVHRAAIVFYLGGGFQPALERILEGTDTRAVDLLTAVELLTTTAGHGDEDDRADGTQDDEADEAVDPHVWLDPLRYAEIVRQVGAELAAEGSAAGLVTELEELHAEFEAGLADCERREIVTSHAAFGYLAERYDLEQISISGLSPEAEPTARDLEWLIEEVREHDATTVFFETLVSPRLAATVAREAGAETAVLNPIEGLTADEQAAGADYFSLMRDNLQTLRGALGCR